MSMDIMITERTVAVVRSCVVSVNVLLKTYFVTEHSNGFTLILRFILS